MSVLHLTSYYGTVQNWKCCGHSTNKVQSKYRNSTIISVSQGKQELVTDHIYFFRDRDTSAVQLASSYPSSVMLDDQPDPGVLVMVPVLSNVYWNFQIPCRVTANPSSFNHLQIAGALR